MWFRAQDVLEKANYGDRWKTRAARGWQGRRDEEAEHKGFQGRETILDDITVVDTRHYEFAKTH